MTSNETEFEYFKRMVKTEQSHPMRDRSDWEIALAKSLIRIEERLAVLEAISLISCT